MRHMYILVSFQKYRRKKIRSKVRYWRTKPENLVINLIGNSIISLNMRGNPGWDHRKTNDGSPDMRNDPDWLMAKPSKLGFSIFSGSCMDMQATWTYADPDLIRGGVDRLIGWSWTELDVAVIYPQTTIWKNHYHPSPTLRQSIFICRQGLGEPWQQCW